MTTKSESYARPTGTHARRRPDRSGKRRVIEIIVPHRRLEVNPKASAARMRRLSGHAVQRVN